ncbi:MAG: phosphoenolpyruvate kinase [Deltaproteobacteria bacterium]|nr:phosphoenolpyruvate kinase [Deltaproteobacteria bacterium]
MKTTVDSSALGRAFEPLRSANRAFAVRYPGEPVDRQAVHTVYGGAHLFRADSAAKLGQLALRSLERFAPNPQTFATALGFGGGEPMAKTVYDRVLEKLGREAVEDFRIDFEDGYGHRPDEEEDRCAVEAAQQVAKGLRQGSLPPFLGIRIKSFSEELVARSSRTLDLFLTAMLEATEGKIPDGFVVTLPKVVVPEQVAALVSFFELFEAEQGLEAGVLRLELMVETPQSLFDPAGRAALPLLVEAAKGRCVAAHFGVYDYTASLQITAEHQTLDHPACDVARNLMQITLAGSGVMLSDGATNVMPVAPHRAAPGEVLTAQQEEENLRSVHGGWRLHFEHVRHSLHHAYYQGWDLHPAQLPTRYAALYSFFLESLEAASERLGNFVRQAAQATLVGDVFDDAATGQGLLNFFLRGINCGAITEQEALATGLTLEELRGRSFLKILENRRG